VEVTKKGEIDMSKVKKIKAIIKERLANIRQMEIPPVETVFGKPRVKKPPV